MKRVVEAGTEISINGVPSRHMFRISTHADKFLRLREKYGLPLHGIVLSASKEQGTVVEILNVVRIEGLSPETLHFISELNSKDHYHFIDIITD